jgi:hypothetical protein
MGSGSPTLTPCLCTWLMEGFSAGPEGVYVIIHLPGLQSLNDPVVGYANLQYGYS